MRILFFTVAYIPAGPLLGISIYADKQYMLTGNEKTMLSDFSRIISDYAPERILTDMHPSLLILIERMRRHGMEALPIEETNEDWHYPVMGEDYIQRVFSDKMYFRPKDCMYLALDQYLWSSGARKVMLRGETITMEERIRTLYVQRRSMNVPPVRTRTYPWHSLVDRRAMYSPPEIFFDIHKLASFLGHKSSYSLESSFPSVPLAYTGISRETVLSETNERCTLLRTIMPDVEDILSFEMRLMNVPNPYVLDGQGTLASVIELMRTRNNTHRHSEVARKRLMLLSSTMSNLREDDNFIIWDAISTEQFCKVYGCDSYMDILHHEYLLNDMYSMSNTIYVSKNNLLF